MSNVIRALEKEFLLPSPLQKLSIPEITDKGILLFIKRDDLIHPLASGNKWRKLKYNVEVALNHSAQTLVTFGGAFSNHLVAVAVVGYHLKLKTVGFLRGYKLDESNPTIHLLRKYKMELILVEPKEYKLKEKGEGFESWASENYNYYVIPEGGTNALAVKGVTEIGEEIQGVYSHVYLGIGTAGTLAGIANSKVSADRIIGVSPFAGNVSSLAGFEFIKDRDRVKIVSALDESRFGAFDQKVCDLIHQLYKAQGVILDPIYTAPAMLRLMDDLTNDEIPEGARVLFIHTGGAQGNMGYNYRYAKKMNALLPVPILEKV